MLSGETMKSHQKLAFYLQKTQSRNLCNSYFCFINPLCSVCCRQKTSERKTRGPINSFQYYMAFPPNRIISLMCRLCLNSVHPRRFQHKNLLTGKEHGIRKLRLLNSRRNVSEAMPANSRSYRILGKCIVSILYNLC